MADVTALAAARHALLRTMGWDVESEGLFGAPPISVDELLKDYQKPEDLLG
jgi:hypothetical protein